MYCTAHVITVAFTDVQLFFQPVCQLFQLFPVAAARAWNSLPSFVTLSSSLSTFKLHLKTYLFAKSY